MSSPRPENNSRNRSRSRSPSYSSSRSSSWSSRSSSSSRSPSPISNMSKPNFDEMSSKEKETYVREKETSNLLKRKLVAEEYEIIVQKVCFFDKERDFTFFSITNKPR